MTRPDHARLNWIVTRTGASYAGDLIGTSVETRNLRTDDYVLRTTSDGGGVQRLANSVRERTPSLA